MFGKPRIITPKIALFLFSMILANLGGSLFFPFFAIYLSKLGLAVDRIGVFFTLSAIFPLVFQIFGGWVSDRIGRLASIAIGSIAGAVSWVTMLLAPSMADPVPWFLASNAVGAITGALVAPSYDAFIAEESEEKNRGRVFGVVQSVFMIVGIAGPPLGGFLAQGFGFQTLAWIAALLYWSATVIRILMARSVARPRAATLTGPTPAEASVETSAAAPAEAVAPPSAEGAKPLQGFARSLKAILGLILAGGVFTWIFLIDGAFDISGKLSGDLLPLFLKQIGGQSETNIGLLQGFSALCMALFMIPLGGVADKYGERLPILGGCLLGALSMFVLWLGHSFALYALSFALSGLAGAALQPAMQSLTSKAVPAKLRGLAYGFLGTSLGLFSFFAPAVGGYLWKAFFPALPFLASGGLILLAALPAWSKLASIPKGEPD